MSRSSSSARRCCPISVEIDADRLVALAVDLVSIPSPTGDEQAMGERVRDELAGMGLRVQWQEVEDGRRYVAHVQRAHGHLVLGAGALAHRDSRFPAGGLRPGRSDLRPRYLEHEGF